MRTQRTKGAVDACILAADGEVLVKLFAYVRQAFAGRFTTFGGWN